MKNFKQVIEMRYPFTLFSLYVFLLCVGIRICTFNGMIYTHGFFYVFGTFWPLFLILTILTFAIEIRF